MIQLLIMLQVAGGCFINKVMAQSSVLNTRISVNCTDKPLNIILQEISQQYHISFSYFKNQLPLQKKISIRSQNSSLREVLNEISTQAGIQYQAVGGQIVLKEATSEKPGNQLNSPSRVEEQILQTDKLLILTHTRNYTTSEKRKTTLQKKEKAIKSQGNKEVSKNIFPNTKQILYSQKFYLDRLINPYRIAQLPAINSFKGIIAPKMLPVPAEKPVFISSTFQLALVPGLSTHGIHPGEYTNEVSFNILAGYSAGNKVVEIGGLSNFNQNHVSGVQIGGLANVVGGNKFVGLSSQEKQKLKKEKPEANMQGMQVAGLTNIIAGNVFGWQTSGGINLVKKSLQGIQLAGISNVVNTYAFGIQLAGISNAAMESVDGVQVAGLYNYTEGELHGIQLSAFNQAGQIEGKGSAVSVDYTGLQIGLLNTAKKMNGYQIGLINIGGEMAGTQIGIVNINSGKKGKGTPIGLFNINSKGHFARLYTSELFASNLEISTGSLRIQNMVSVGFNPVKGGSFYKPTWSLGYSIGKIKRPFEQFFYSYDAGIAHINQSGKITKGLSLLTKARITAGYQIHLPKIVFHVFGGLTFNTYFAEKDTNPISPQSFRIYHTTNNHSHIEMWPGFVAGIHL